MRASKRGVVLDVSAFHRARTCDSARVEPRVVHATARILAACLTGTRPLDQEIARGLKEAKGLDDEMRGAVVRVIGRALAHRGLYTRALTLLPFEARREGLVLAALVDMGEKVPLPREDRLALADALSRARTGLSDDERVLLESPVPAWLHARLRNAYGDDAARALALVCATPPPLTVRANTLVSDREALRASLAGEGISSMPTALSPVGLTLAERVPIRRTAAFKEGALEVQDEGSQLIALATGAGPGMVVVDACAGAGGKTLALAALMQNKGTLYAFDINTRRLDDAGDRARRAGVHNIRTHALDDAGRRAQKRLFGTCDVVLVDAPCSGSGTLRRSPDIGWKLSEGDVPRLTTTQREILDQTAPLVKPGGRLIYATCSLLPDENTMVIDAFLGTHPEFTRAPLAFSEETRVALSSSSEGDAITLLPHVHGTDGFFVCAMERRR
jgi:16S rRNA (cytosine967-C5)-methyltransferase